jgi:hypothetical protein
MLRPCASNLGKSIFESLMRFFVAGCRSQLTAWNVRLAKTPLKLNSNVTTTLKAQSRTASAWPSVRMRSFGQRLPLSLGGKPNNHNADKINNSKRRTRFGKSLDFDSLARKVPGEQIGKRCGMQRADSR